MTNTTNDLVDRQIDLAYELIERNRPESAVHAFAVARSLSVTDQAPGAVQRKIDGLVAALIRERESYRDLIGGRRKANRSTVVIADSLGLPRPDDKVGKYHGAERTYPFLLLDERPDVAVDSYCQRYFTTREVLDLLYADAALGTGSDVIMHIGLNDCATRMFLEPDRLALDLLAPETKSKVVSFAQRHRRLILKHLPEYHYVDPAEFRANLDTILSMLTRRRARRIVVTTIIVPPIRFWPATPGIQRNFANYNHMLMDAAARHGAALLDIDRHVWAHQHENVLLTDGMHLALAGHQLFAREATALLI